MASMADRIALWDEIHELLPPRWRVPAAPGYDPSTRCWEIVARGPMPGGRRGRNPPYVIGNGQTELDALADLVRRLGRPANRDVGAG
jgi:hypothetical protein